MSVLEARLQAASKYAGGEMQWRLTKELAFAGRVSRVSGNRFDQLLLKALDALDAAVARDGAVTNATVLAIEDMLQPMAEQCKKYRLLFVGHAHIDMNWMWRYDETVSITLDTFRTMLNLMKEFPRFTFAQSQASTYAIVEEFDPEMIDEIRAAIKRGQWEVTASTWVEADRNLPSAESVARHFLYTKRYLPNLLGVDADALNLDFEPDTFGHHQNVPELLADAGVKYYYHCRGEAEAVLYRWRAPSGREILVFREPWWYLGSVDGDHAQDIPLYCERFGLDTWLTVYGVGDHGGGPTRRDLERIVDMGTWPIYPRVEFGTYAEFFKAAEGATKIPVLTGERNFVLHGCYTTQTRIKQGNRMAERMLYDAEAMAALSSVHLNTPYRRAAFEGGWRKVLFNQFHDIIPGSGVIDTREHAMGYYSQAFAVAGSGLRAALNAFAAAIDTTAFPETDAPGTTGEGAGQGFGVYDFKLGQVSRGGGANRIFHVFNTLPEPRKEVVEFILWDYREPLERIEFVGADGKTARHQVLDKRFHEYWQHEWAKVLVEVEVPAMGYATYALRQKPEMEAELRSRTDPRVDEPFEMVLENGLIRAEFRTDSASVRSLTDLASGKKANLSEAGFCVVDEDSSRGMTSWIVGRHIQERGIDAPSRIRLVADGPLYKAYEVEAPFGNGSKLTYTVSLRAGERRIEYDVRCDWQERSHPGETIPQLSFLASGPMETRRCLCDIPGGLIERDARAQDVPTQGMIRADGIELLCDSKYGFRFDGGRLSATLIRSSFDPDPYPELGEHHFRLALGLGNDEGAALIMDVAKWNHPLHVVSGSRHWGALPPAKSFMALSGGAMISGVKLCEDEDALLVRLMDVNGGGKAELTFDRPVKRAAMVNSLERETGALAEVEGAVVRLDLGERRIGAVKVTFA